MSAPAPPRRLSTPPRAAGGGEDRRYADKRWRGVGSKRAMDAAQRVYEEVRQDILDYDARNPPDQQMAQDEYLFMVETLRVHMRDHFLAGVVDAAELKRLGRAFVKLPKRLHKAC